MLNTLRINLLRRVIYRNFAESPLPSAVYKEAVSNGEFHEDPGQLEALIQLDEVYF